MIHGYISASIINNILGSNNPFSVIIATLIGVTMYADIFGTLLIAEALVLKGVGTLPSVGKLKKILLTCWKVWKITKITFSLFYVII